MSFFYDAPNKTAICHLYHPKIGSYTPLLQNCISVFCILDVPPKTKLIFDFLIHSFNKYKYLLLHFITEN